MEHTPLDPDRLSEDARRALGPGPMRMMAARGLAPLPRPADLLTVLYQLHLDPEAAVRAAAEKSAGELPDPVLTGGLGDPHIEPRVLDYFAGRLAARPQLAQVIITNPAAADETIEALAGRVGEHLIDLIAENEQRLLRHPAIIAAMYQNRAARMSVVDRVVELAVRNQVRVPGLATWDEIAAAVLGGKPRRAPAAPPAGLAAGSAELPIESSVESPAGAPAADDQLFTRALTASDGKDPEAPEARDKDLPLSQMSVPMKIRLASLGNAFSRAQLIRDPIRLVAMAVIKAPGINEAEAAKYAANNALHEDVIAYIASRREWTKLYNVKLALAQNPKTPVAMAMRLLPHLREKDLRNISRSKGVPSAVAAGARKLLMSRQGGDK
jgi:hypothetical protein